MCYWGVCEGYPESDGPDSIKAEGHATTKGVEDWVAPLVEVAGMMGNGRPGRRTWRVQNLLSMIQVGATGEISSLMTAT